MGKKAIVIVILIVSVMILAGREWVVHQEISATKVQLRTQMKEQFELASDIERLQLLATAPTVYDRFLEPVFVSAQKLIWPFSRESAMNEWRREVHASVDDMVYQRKMKIKADVDAEVAKIHTDNEPSIQRLLNVLEVRSRLLAEPDLKNAVRNEIQQISSSSREQDEKTLKEIRAQGLDIFKRFKGQLHRMDLKAFATFVMSGTFNRDVQQPILDLVFRLRQEDTRRNTWKEFQKALSEVLNESRPKLAHNSKKQNLEKRIVDDSKKFQALFDSVADAVRREDERTPSSRLKVPTPQPDFNLETSNPAGPDYDQ